PARVLVSDRDRPARLCRATAPMAYARPSISTSKRSTLFAPRNGADGLRTTLVVRRQDEIVIRPDLVGIEPIHQRPLEPAALRQLRRPGLRILAQLRVRLSGLGQELPPILLRR